jgi:tRNA modification GTPase
VNLVSRLYDATEGSVCVGGHDVREYDMRVLRDSVAVVLQKNLLFSGTIKENLRWGDPNATDEEMVESLELLLADCQRLLNSFQTGRAINSGVSAVIVGKPNAGKSTFFNRLLGEERAIVTSIPGTTRDLIEYPVKLGRVLVNLSDTAGVREAASDRVEEIGIERAIGAVKDAELVFVLFDRSRPLEDEDRLVLKEVLAKDGGVVVPILTKSDLLAVLYLSELPFDLDSYFVSDSDKCDFSSLVERIEKAFISDEAALREGRILTNARQKSDLVKGMTLVSEAVNQIQSGLKDVASLTLEAALGAFLEIDGKSAGEKILDEVFSRFCIGK